MTAVQFVITLLGLAVLVPVLAVKVFSRSAVLAPVQAGPASMAAGARGTVYGPDGRLRVVPIDQVLDVDGRFLNRTPGQEQT